MKGKKGAETTIGTIVTIILAVIVLIFVIAGFTMGWSNLMGKIKTIMGSGGESIDAAVFACNTKCTITSQANDFCCGELNVKGLDPSNLKKPTPISCKALQEKFPQAITCDAAFCEPWTPCPTI